jgi:hypothetical protein
MHGFTPGIAPAPLTKEPLGTEGEMTPGPDSLNPNIPEDKDELVNRGYFEADEQLNADVADFGTVPSPEPFFEQVEDELARF